ncbi:MAG TPA: FKBP-type peptidyl-prolyl cis-trans isomerase [Chitinophagaceae bacterium]|nr:FKBP-type peptidyl-prolyl cis-trans isomerase [Chitinophagaceae bacterium]
MKNYFTGLVLLAGMGLLTQCKTPQQTTVTPVTAVAVDTVATDTLPLLKTLADSAGYALGVNIGSSLLFQNMTEINTDMITKAIGEVLSNQPTLIDENMALTVLNNYANKMQEEKSQQIIDSGRAFLERNKLRPEVKVTASGLQYEVIREGTGIKPAALDTFVCHYRGTLIDGTEFDASYNRNEPLVYPLNQVIRGWTEGLQLMAVGSHYKLYIPHELGYGVHGSPPAIPGGAVLVFELELLDVKKRK